MDIENEIFSKEESLREITNKQEISAKEYNVI
jgi:hypothetical protein